MSSGIECKFSLMLQVKGETATAGQKAWHWTIVSISSLLAVATTISAARLIFTDIRDYHLFADQ